MSFVLTLSTKLWFDGGYSASQMDKIEALLQQYQPQACIFNSCDTNGTCLSSNAIRWIGTESESPSFHNANLLKYLLKHLLK